MFPTGGVPQILEVARSGGITAKALVDWLGEIDLYHEGRIEAAVPMLREAHAEFGMGHSREEMLKEHVLFIAWQTLRAVYHNRDLLDTYSWRSLLCDCTLAWYLGDRTWIVPDTEEEPW